MKDGAIKEADALRFTIEGFVECKNNLGRLKVMILHGNADEPSINEDKAIVWAEQRRGDYKKDSVPVRLFRQDGTEINDQDGNSYDGYFLPPHTPVTVEVDLRGFDLSRANKMTVKLIGDQSGWSIKAGPMEFIKRKR